MGRFLSEDPVFGRIGAGVSFNHFQYGWNNPINRYDLNGRDVCAPTPFGDACAGEAVDDVWDGTAPGRDWLGVAGDGNGGWLSEAPGYVNDRAHDFAKSDVGQWGNDRADEVGRTFECIAERAVLQPGSVGCQEESEQFLPEPDDPGSPPNPPLPGVPGKDPLPNLKR